METSGVSWGAILAGAAAACALTLLLLSLGAGLGFAVVSPWGGRGIDAAVHAQAAAGHQAGAVALTLGTYGAPLGLAFKSLDWGPRLGAQRDWSEGELGYAFEAFDWELAQLTQMLQRQFDATMDGVERTLAEAIGLQALSVAAAALTFAGLRPRIAEYSV